MLTILVAMVLSICSIGLIFFFRSQRLMEEQIDLRLLSAAQVASLQFSSSELDLLKGREFIDTNVLTSTVLKLNAIRNSVPNVQFVHLLRPTAQAGIMETIADADLIHGPADLDRNGNGRIDPPEEPFYPGDHVRMGSSLVLEKGLNHAIVDRSLSADATALFVTAFSPIKAESGQIIAVMAMGMNETSYGDLSKRLASPVILGLIAMFALLLGGYLGYYSWQRRAELQSHLQRGRALLQQLAVHQLSPSLVTLKASATVNPQALDRLAAVIDALRGEQEQSIPLRTLVERVLNFERAKLNADNYDLRVDIQPSLNVSADPELLACVLRELIDNARLFSNPGTTIKVEGNQKGKRLEIVVSDDGRGVITSDKDLIFQPYIRGTNAEKMHPDGIGLGLALAKEAVLLMGGKLELDSQAGQGTKVKVIINNIQI